MKFSELKDFHFFTKTDSQNVYQKIEGGNLSLLVVVVEGDNAYLSQSPIDPNCEVEEIDVKDLVFTETEIQENEIIL